MRSHDAAHDPAAPHAGHDLLLVAAHAAGDTVGEAAGLARQLIAGCGECRDLAADLGALRAASQQLPPPQRSRDFRLSSEAAARLRSRSPWRRLVEGVTAPRGFGRPLAAALMTLGLAGLMVSATPLGAPLSATFSSGDTAERALAPSNAGSGVDGGAAPEAPAPSGAPGDRTTQDAATASLDSAKGAPSAAVSPSPAVPPAAMAAAPSGAAGQGATPAPANMAPGEEPAAGPAGSRAPASPGALAANGGPDAARDATTPSGWNGPSPLALLSAALLVLGLGIVMARRLAQSRLA